MVLSVGFQLHVTGDKLYRMFYFKITRNEEYTAGQKFEIIN